jgi:hypothetical protein
MSDTGLTAESPPVYIEVVWMVAGLKPAKQRHPKTVREVLYGTHIDLDIAGVPALRSCRVPAYLDGMAPDFAASCKEEFLGTVGEHRHRLVQ